MNVKTVVILLVVLVIGVGSLLLTQSGSSLFNEQPGNDVRRDHPIMPDLDLSAEYRRISIRLPQTGQDIGFVYDTHGWHVESPYIFPANTRKLDELMTILANLRGNTSRRPHEPAEGDPGLSIKFYNNVYTLRLGPRTGAGQGLLHVIRQSDHSEHTYVIDDALHDLFENLDLSRYYADSVETFLMPEYERVVIDVDNQQSRLIQFDNTWWINQPEFGERALDYGLEGYVGVDNYFELLNSIKFTGLQEYDTESGDGLKQFGLHRPLIRALFVPIQSNSDHAQKGWQVSVGVPADPADQSRFISYGRPDDPNPAVFTVPTPIALAFAQDITNFRDPRVIRASPALVQHIAFKRYGKDNTLAQSITFDPGKPPVFKSGDDRQVDLSPEACRGMIQGLAKARAEGYIETRLAEWDATVSVLVSTRVGDDPDRFTIYPDPESNGEKPTVLVHRGKEPVALRIERSAVSGLIDPESLMPDRPDE